jgi:polyhydroxyalkanoate synthase subunit PhaE
MSDSAKPAFDPNTMFQQWMKSMTDAWSGVLTPHQPTPDPAPTRENSPADKGAGNPSMDAALRLMKASTSVFSDTRAWPGMFSGLQSLPHVFMNMAQPMIENMSQMHRQWFEKMEAIGKLPDSFDPGHLEKESLNIFNRLYDAEFKKFLNIPQLGPARQYQEKVNRYIDRLTMLQTAVAEFLHHLYAPMEKAFTAFQKKIADLAEARQLPGDAKAYYQLWLKTLEGQYMITLRTPEYLGALSKTLMAAAEHARARKDLLNDVMHNLSLPAPGDIDSLYQDLYALKKRLKAVENHLGDRLNK